MTLKLFHQTSIGALRSILVSRTYITAPIQSDAGVNCFNVDRESQQRQIFEGSGVIMFFEWRGEVRRGGQYDYHLEKDVLYNMLPWRCFIPAGSNPGLLRVTRFRITESAMKEYIGKCGPDWWPTTALQARYRRRKLAILLEMRNAVRKQACHLRIVVGNGDVMPRMRG